MRRWRASALEALHAFIAGPLATAPPAQRAALAEGVAVLLAPTLDAICACPPLQVALIMCKPESAGTCCLKIQIPSLNTICACPLLLVGAHGPDGLCG